MGTFVVGICAGESGKLERHALPGLDAVLPDCPRIILRHQSSLAGAYNEVLRQASLVDDLEGVLLIHDDVELRDPAILATVRRAFADESVGLVGVIGGRGVKSLSWWDWSPRGRVIETRGTLDFGGLGGDVDNVDGLLMALPARVACSLRFDAETFDFFDGYDVDFAFQVRRAGYRVVVESIDLVHHTKAVLADNARFDDSTRRLQQKWSLTITARDHLRRRITRLRARWAFKPAPGAT